MESIKINFAFVKVEVRLCHHAAVSTTKIVQQALTVQFEMFSLIQEFALRNVIFAGVDKHFFCTVVPANEQVFLSARVFQFRYAVGCFYTHVFVCHAASTRKINYMVL